MNGGESKCRRIAVEKLESPGNFSSSLLGGGFHADWCIVKGFGQKDDWVAALPLISSYVSGSRPLPTAFLKDALNTLSRGGQWEWAHLIFTQWSRPLSPGNVVSVSDILLSHGRSSDVLPTLSVALRDKTKAFRRAAYFGVVTAAHNRNVPKLADECYECAVKARAMPWIVSSYNSTTVTFDLHSLNVAGACGAVRVGLREVFRDPDVDVDVVIVTGRGKNSKVPYEPILRPQIQDLLIDAIYPPLPSYTLRGNLGAIMLEREGVREWVSWESWVKGRLLVGVAGKLRGVGERVRKAVERKGRLEGS